MKTIVNFMNGRFGRKVLRPKYARIWKAVTYSVVTIATFLFIFLPILQACSWVSNLVNYVVWG